MKIILTALFSCLLPVVLCWKFPGYPDVDCLTAREKTMADPNNRKVVPKCNEDGTYQDMQCYDDNYPDTCFCTYKDGTLITVPGFGPSFTSCLCIVMSHDRLLLDEEEGHMNCANGGYFNPLQCSKKTGECWCVTKYGNQVASPSPDRKSCDDVAHLL
ncbi:unnamed protein product [Larinioides sclopetarius]|uniref:Thyroglobulin type-1 domain-containing protein n=1 Tax=Larinioides sclopetarius TaxID=280406 RepID=A0AAV2B8Q2_9ARAC